MDKMDLIPIFILVLFLGSFVVFLVDDVYKKSMAAEKANQICQGQGYDYYEDFKRIGIWSTEPVAIKCKYVENYKEVDMNVRKISED